MPRMVALSVEPGVAQMMPGERLTIAITVQNSGPGDERYHIGVIGLPYAWYDLDTPAVELAPAASARVSLVLHPSGDIITARYPFNVQVVPDGDPTHMASALVNLMVVDGAAVGVAAAPRKDTVGAAPRPDSTMGPTYDVAESPRRVAPSAIRVPSRLHPRTVLYAALALALLVYTVASMLPNTGRQGVATPAPTPTLPARVAGLAHRAAPSAATVSQPEVLLNPTGLDFGRQRLIITSDARFIHIANLGLAPLTITRIAVAGRNASDFAAQAPCLRTPIAVDGGCAISVRFTPTAAGARAARLVISSNAARSPHSVALAGRA